MRFIDNLAVAYFLSHPVFVKTDVTWAAAEQIGRNPTMNYQVRSGHRPQMSGGLISSIYLIIRQHDWL